MRPEPTVPLASVMALLIALVAATAAKAEPFAFATTPGKLPKTVVPVRYALDLTPDLAALTLAGSETVDIDVRESTDRLVLNAVDIAITQASIDGDAMPATVEVDAKAETVTLAFPQPIPAGRHQLRIAFGAKINKFSRGLFVVDYPVGDSKKRMLASHLEPADARRIFPGWDEPAFKASFDLTVTVPDTLLAVSNMPIASESAASGGSKRVTFARTPAMSSYLFVLAVGALERVTTETDGVTIGVVTTQGKSASASYALEQAGRLLRYYDDYFGVKYALPKLDLIAVPGGFGGAMENWGGITFFESRLLFDPASSARDARRGIFGILAHEMAHQWFGDLVTTAWWDNIWLNEGFASWMQNKAADALQPDWQVWVNSGAKQGAMAADARRSAHPVQQPVANETEAMAAFDVITYSKGQALIRMIESYLGEDKFRAGIRRYVHDHAFSNATTDDMWNALEAASGAAVAKVAAAFTSQAGVPLIVAEGRCVDGEQRLALRQDRFTIRNPGAEPQHWNVPIVYGPIPATHSPRTVVLEEPFELAAGRCGEAVKLNLGDVGYYRVRYDAATQALLARSLGAMAPVDRVNLLADAWALVESGQGAPASYFTLIEQLGGESNRAVWDQVMRTLSRIDHLEQERPQRAAFQAYARMRLRTLFDRLGWKPADGETADLALLRPRLVRVLGDLGDAAIVAEAKRRFAAFLADASSLPADLRDPVLHLVGRDADRATYDMLIGLARKTTQTGERMRYFSAAASARDPALAKETLALSLTEELPNSMVGTLISWVASQGEHRALALDFVLANYAALVAKQSPSFRNNFVANLMTNFADRKRAAELDEFAPAHESSGGRIMAARARERILTDADFVEQELPAIDDWIARHQSGR